MKKIIDALFNLIPYPEWIGGTLMIFCFILSPLIYLLRRQWAWFREYTDELYTKLFSKFSISSILSLIKSFFKKEKKVKQDYGELLLVKLNSSSTSTPQEVSSILRNFQKEYSISLAGSPFSSNEKGVSMRLEVNCNKEHFSFIKTDTGIWKHK